MIFQRLTQNDYINTDPDETIVQGRQSENT